MEGDGDGKGGGNAPGKPQGGGNAPEGVDTAEALKTAQGRVQELVEASDGLRASRDAALRENHALRAMLGAHNVPVALDAGKLAALKVESGVVSGEYAYAPPKVETKPAGAGASKAGGANGGATALTYEDLAKLPHDEVNKRWAEVRSLLETGPA